MTTPKTLTVLYIEDDPASKKLLQQFMQSYSSIHFITAWSAEEGIALADKHKPGLVFLDIMLPCMNGREAIQALRKLEGLQALPVYAISADAIAEHIENTLKAGFNGYLTKPVSLQKIAQIVEQALNG